MDPSLATVARLPESRLYTFLDEAGTFALYFLEGQRLVHDLALRTGVRGEGFAYLRDVLLSVQPMIALINGGEQLGFYLDSEAPFFRLKIETGHHGDVRCALVPDTFRDFPESTWGVARVLKLFPNNRPPYQSVIDLEGLPLREIVNRVLDRSYQVRSAVMVSRSSDQSAMLHQLPPIKGKESYEYSDAALAARRAGIASALEEIFAAAPMAPGEVVEAFARIGFRPIADRGVRWRCSCSRDRMIENILVLQNVATEELFDPGQEALDVVCDYCGHRYEISRTDLRRLPERPN
jgi:molecular chaperone Hsp33